MFFIFLITEFWGLLRTAESWMEFAITSFVTTFIFSLLGSRYGQWGKRFSFGWWGQWSPSFFFWQILILRSVISWLQSICKKTAHGVVLEVVHVIHADLVSTVCITKLVEFYHVDLRLCWSNGLSLLYLWHSNPIFACVRWSVNLFLAVVIYYRCL